MNRLLLLGLARYVDTGAQSVSRARGGRLSSIAVAAVALAVAPAVAPRVVPTLRVPLL